MKLLPYTVPIMKSCSLSDQDEGHFSHVYYGNITSFDHFIKSIGYTTKKHCGHICYLNKLLDLLVDPKRQMENLIGFYQYIF